MLGISNKFLDLEFYDFQFSNLQLCLDGEDFSKAYVLMFPVVITKSLYRTLV
jgi:hypothetical protein